MKTQGELSIAELLHQLLHQESKNQSGMDGDGKSNGLVELVAIWATMLRSEQRQLIAIARAIAP